MIGEHNTKAKQIRAQFQTRSIRCFSLFFLLHAIDWSIFSHFSKKYSASFLYHYLFNFVFSFQKTNNNKKFPLRTNKLKWWNRSLLMCVISVKWWNVWFQLSQRYITYSLSFPIIWSGKCEFIVWLLLATNVVSGHIHLCMIVVFRCSHRITSRFTTQQITVCSYICELIKKGNRGILVLLVSMHFP